MAAIQQMLLGLKAGVSVAQNWLMEDAVTLWLMEDGVTPILMEATPATEEGLDLMFTGYDGEPFSGVDDEIFTGV